MVYKKSDHYDGKLFLNHGESFHKNIIDVVKWRLTRNRTKWPSWVENTATPNFPATISTNQIVTTFINHASHLIQLQYFNILTDPVYSQRVSPLKSAGPKRVRNPGIAFAKLPKIDLVVISHNHYDHMDVQTVRDLEAQHHPVFVVPLGNAVFLKKLCVGKVVELDWWQNVQLDTVKVTLVPAQHWSSRHPN